LWEHPGTPKIATNPKIHTTIHGVQGVPLGGAFLKKTCFLLM